MKGSDRFKVGVGTVIRQTTGQKHDIGRGDCQSVETVGELEFATGDPEARLAAQCTAQQLRLSSV